MSDTPTASTNPKGAQGKRKPRMHFVPPIALLQEAKVMELGGSKYGPYNWQDSAVDASTYYDAAMRHLMSWFCGEANDPESGMSHLAHVRACCGILIDAESTGQLIDDRPAKVGSASAFISEQTKTE